MRRRRKVRSGRRERVFTPRPSPFVPRPYSPSPGTLFFDMLSPWLVVVSAPYGHRGGTQRGRSTFLLSIELCLGVKVMMRRRAGAHHNECGEAEARQAPGDIDIGQDPRARRAATSGGSLQGRECCTSMLTAPDITTAETGLKCTNLPRALAVRRRT